MKKYITKQFIGCNLGSGYIYKELENWLNDNSTNYILDQMTATTTNGFIQLVAVMKLKED